MNNLFVIRGKMQEIYAKYSNIVDKIIQFILALTTFFLINNNIGFMKVLAQPVVTLMLAVICTVFPMLITILAATALVLCHLYVVSLGVMLVTAVIFLIMFALYLRLTPQKAAIVLLTPIAFMLKIPYVIPIACALVSGPVTMFAIALGIIIFYMLRYIKLAVPTFQGEEVSMLTQISAYVKQVFQDKQMWVVITAFMICYFLVYVIRRHAMDHAWKVAIAVGALVNIIVITAGNIVLGEHTAYGSLIVGSIVAIVAGVLLEFFLFSVDYAKSENLQFEDDEYYYYVKAIPKLTVSTQEKTVKRINERYDVENNESLEEDSVRSELKENEMKENEMKENEIDEVLLAQSLEKELQ